MVDAAGAIYVIGGTGDGGPDFADVWASTDGGARAGLGRGGDRGVLEGVLKWGTTGVIRGTKG